MSGRLRLSLAVGRYDLHDALIRGAVVPQGVDLTVLVYRSAERHWRMLRNAEFDICEVGMGSFLPVYDAGDAPLVAIPAFPHRRFRHGYVFVRADAEIEEPGQLDGRRIGLFNWQATVGLWARGILQDEHGVDLSSIDWVTQAEEEVPLDHVGRFRIRPSGGTPVVDLLLAGQLDALILPDVPEQIDRGDPRIRRLFPDPKQADIDYYARTGCFPIMHTVVLRRSLHEANPWLAAELLIALRESKDRAFSEMHDPRRVSLAWLIEAREEQERILGADPWAYGLEANRRPLETMLRYAQEQGLTRRALSPEELFVPSTL